VLRLSNDALSAKPRVEFQAVVTGVDKSHALLFVQDATAGIFLYQVSPPVDLSPGDWIALRGVAGKGLFSPMIASAQVTVLGRTNLPRARPISLGTLNSGTALSDRVEVEGIVQRTRLRGDHLFLNLASGQNDCTVSIIHTNSTVPDLTDTRVRVSGIAAAAFNKKQEVTGFQVMVPDLSGVQVLVRPATPAWGAPVFSLGDVARRGSHTAGEHRIHVRGVVTLHWPERLTVLQDATGSVAIEAGLAGTFQSGDDVEAIGFLVQPLESGRLRHAEGRRVGAGQAIVARPGTVTQAFERPHRLVQVSGKILEWQAAQDGEISAIVSSNHQFFRATLREASAPALMAAFPPGSIVSFTGVARGIGRDSSPGGFTLLLRSPGDLLLLKAPVSQVQWAWRVATVGASLLVLVAGVFLAAWLRQRRALAKAAAQQHEAERRFSELERELRSSHRERETIQHELHDNIIQSIYSIGLGLEEARRMAEDQPERVAERLNVAVENLNTLIRGLRAFLGGLEPKGLEGHELRAALKSVLLASGDVQEARFSLRIDPNVARSLTSLQATEIFNIAKEAMMNSMRHANAERTTVALVPTNSGARLDIEDNGMGFDPASVGPDSLGLRHMRQRARTIGADFDLQASPGKGVRIRVEIPCGRVQSARDT
jgi:signal transduction histidine kinase